MDSTRTKRVTKWCIDVGWPWGVYLWPGAYLQEEVIRRPTSTCEPMLWDTHEAASTYLMNLRRMDRGIMPGHPHVRAWRVE